MSLATNRLIRHPLPCLTKYNRATNHLCTYLYAICKQQLTASTAPSSSSRRPLSEIETMRDVHTRESDGARFTALYDGRVRSVFSDRTILEVRPHERFVRALLPDGECAFYDLQKCMDIASAALSAENTFCPLVEPSEMPKYTKFLDNECLLGHYMSPGKITTTIHTLGYSSGADTPSLIVAEQVQSLLAFKRWSDTPREKVFMIYYIRDFFYHISNRFYTERCRRGQNSKVTESVYY